MIVLSYNQYNEKVKGLFLLYKHASYKELNKKNDLYTRAEELVKATAQNGQAWLEIDVYNVISQLESALYDVTVKLQNGNKGTDNRTGEDDATEN